MKCSVCELEKEKDNFWPRTRCCKDCKNEKRRQRKRENPEKYYASGNVRQKKCPICGRTHSKKSYSVCSLRCLIISRIEKKDSCWMWKGSKNEHGYGTLAINRKTFFAHRISFQEFVSEIPKNRCLLHKCDTPLCVNPDHLRIGTRSENAKEMYEKKRNRCQRGEQRYCAKLKEVDVKKIKVMLSQGLKQQEIADLFGVHNCSISNIKTGVTWKHVT